MTISEEEIRDFYASLPARHRARYEERWQHFARDLPMLTDPPLCNHYGFPVPKEWVEKVTRRKKDDLYIIKFRDFSACSHCVSEEDAERLSAAFDADRQRFGDAEAHRRQEAAELECMELIFDTWWAASFDGIHWGHAMKRKDVVAAADNVPAMERIAYAVNEPDDRDAKR